MPILYYVRHGETDFNAEQRLQGRIDTLLNARGRAQAKECGDLLRDLFARDKRSADDFVYVASPLQRARETMEIMRPHAWSAAAALRDRRSACWRFPMARGKD